MSFKSGFVMSVGGVAIKLVRRLLGYIRRTGMGFPGLARTMLGVMDWAEMWGQHPGSRQVIGVIDGLNKSTVRTCRELG